MPLSAPTPSVPLLNKVVKLDYDLHIILSCAMLYNGVTSTVSQAFISCVEAECAVYVVFAVCDV